MFEEDAPSEELLAGRRALEGMPGVTLIEDYRWYAISEDHGVWVLRCRLKPETQADGPIPASTDWYVLVDPSYPWGKIYFYPAADNGLTLTFQHQNRNDPGASSALWRTGDICLDTTVRSLGSSALDTEPYDADQRLRWRFHRALDWLKVASFGELVLPGEPFELPQYLPTTGGLDYTAVFSEGADTLAEWKGVKERAGFVELVVTGDSHSLLVAKRFASPLGNTILTPNWGTTLAAANDNVETGAWIRLKEPPVSWPWKGPVTWGELRRACKDQGLNFAKRLGYVSRHLRYGNRHALLLGFPIPQKADAEPHRMHWQALLLPELSRGKQTINGFRANETGYRARDRQEVLIDAGPVDWLNSENWHREDLSSRGRLPEGLASRKVLLLGGGALGSAIGELLTRAGVDDIVVMDDDRLEIGNLVRHTLGLGEIHMAKASGLARRLNHSSPHARIQSIEKPFPPTTAEDREAVQRCDLVLDCTGDDATLRQLKRFPWEDQKVFVSVSLGFEAQRLFCFVATGTEFPEEEYREAVEPWLDNDVALYEESGLPREGVGCWHPVFPARIDSVWMMATTAVKVLEEAYSYLPSRPRLTVFEQREEHGLYGGIRRVEEPRC